MLVEMKVKELIDPMVAHIQDLQSQLNRSQNQVFDLTKQILQVDKHYMKCCRMLAATQGIPLQQVTDIAIQDSFLKHLQKAQDMRQKMHLTTREDEINAFKSAMQLFSTSDEEGCLG